MHKLIILLISLTFTAASCNLVDPFSVTSGARGVFKSEDGGESFYPFNNTEQRKDGIGGVSVNVLIFDPTNTDVIYLGSSSGIYKTENGGVSWRYILTGMAVSDLSIDFGQNETIYAAGLSGSNGKIIKSLDGGANWSDMYTEPTKANSVTSIANSGSLVLAGLGSGEIIRSIDSGSTWQAVQDLAHRIVKIRFGPTDTVYALTQTGGVFRSKNNGNTWGLITSALSTDSLSNSQTTVPQASLFHDFALDRRQAGVIYLAAEEGLYRSVNDGAAWNILNLPVKDTALKISAVAVNPSNSNNIFVSIGFTVFKSLNGALTWETKELRTEQTVRTILIDPSSANVVYLGLGDKK